MFSPAGMAGGGLGGASSSASSSAHNNSGGIVMNPAPKSDANKTLVFVVIAIFASALVTKRLL